MNTCTVGFILLLASQYLFSQIPPAAYVPTDSIFFEHNTIPYHISPTPGNTWQVGTPAKNYFNQAYSLPWAIVTDSSVPYPVNTNSSFTFGFPNFTISGIYLEFLQKYDSDTLTDYGSIEVSYNHGSTWTILNDSMCQNGDCVQLFWSGDVILSNLTTLPHFLHPSGYSQGWIKSRYTWWERIPSNQNSLLIPTDSIFIKFSFVSDSIQTNKDGWMIDNIIIGILDLGTGLKNLNKIPNVTLYPNPLTCTSFVTCTDCPSGSSLEIYDLLGKLILREPIDQKSSLLLKRIDFVSGIFLWKVKSNDRLVQFGKLVVQ